eukprot:749486-Hanusia_phi.AAC.4
MVEGMRMRKVTVKRQRSATAISKMLDFDRKKLVGLPSAIYRIITSFTSIATMNSSSPMNQVVCGDRWGSASVTASSTTVTRIMRPYGLPRSCGRRRLACSWARRLGDTACPPPGPSSSHPQPWPGLPRSDWPARSMPSWSHGGGSWSHSQGAGPSSQRAPLPPPCRTRESFHALTEEEESALAPSPSAPCQSSRSTENSRLELDSLRGEPSTCCLPSAAAAAAAAASRERLPASNLASCIPHSITARTEQTSRAAEQPHEARVSNQ